MHRAQFLSPPIKCTCICQTQPALILAMPLSSVAMIKKKPKDCFILWKIRRMWLMLLSSNVVGDHADWQRLPSVIENLYPQSWDKSTSLGSKVIALSKGRSGTITVSERGGETRLVKIEIPPSWMLLIWSLKRGSLRNAWISECAFWLIKNQSDSNILQLFFSLMMSAIPMMHRW